MGVPEENIEDIKLGPAPDRCLKCLKHCDYPQPGSPRSRNSDGSTFSVLATQKRDTVVQKLFQSLCDAAKSNFLWSISALDWDVVECSDSLSAPAALSSFTPTTTDM